MNRRRLRNALELARGVIEVQVEEIELLTAERDEAVRLLADEHATHHPYCCVDGDDLCHIGQFRALLDVSGDDREDG